MAATIRVQLRSGELVELPAEEASSIARRLLAEEPSFFGATSMAAHLRAALEHLPASTAAIEATTLEEAALRRVGAIEWAV